MTILALLRKIFKSKRRRFQENNLDRFMKKIKVTNNECWEWTGCLTGGYGQFWSKQFNMEWAHRAAWRMFIGSPRGSIVCHKCHNRACVNPDHLYLGSHSTNAYDRERRKRFQKSKSSDPIGPTRLFTGKTE